MPKLIVGLGNPGRQYAATRHNVGFMVVDAFAKKQGLAVTRSDHQALLAEARWKGERLVLLKPQTYMNLSGFSVSSAARWYKVEPQDIMVIHDDLDLEVGRLRIRTSGGAGGHKGIISMIEQLGTPDFARLKVGIGRPAPGWEVPDYVLTPFASAERETIDAAISRSVEAVEMVLDHGYVAAMNQFNA